MAKKKRDLRIPWPKPKPIEEATPEEMAFALLSTPPKRDDEWKYLKQGKRDEHGEVNGD